LVGRVWARPPREERAGGRAERAAVLGNGAHRGAVTFRDRTAVKMILTWGGVGKVFLTGGQMIVTIVGAGRLAEGVAVRTLAGGHRLRVTDSEPGRADALVAALAVRPTAAEGARSSRSMATVAEAIAGADVVILALPYPEGRAVAREQGAALSGVTVVDTCNPVDFSTFDSLLTSPGMSAAEEIAAACPTARVVKAFNTTFASALVAGWVGGLPLDVFLAGDDARAKAQVAALARDGGLRPVDTGPLRRARELEAFQLLHMTLQGPLGLDWASAVKLLP
jgi:predicted dinucleotide-binding enzyme